MTDAELRLWSRIRLRQLEGFQFYRQRIIGNYIVDFFCPTAKLVIEVDGGQHLSGCVAKSDVVRDSHMTDHGLKVLRFTDTDVLTNIEGVVDIIVANLASAAKANPPVSPFSKGGGTKRIGGE